ncbi:hypothetical protein [Actinotalea sp.]|uniref:hypothetical protein n=1 Tax=Actinotalea sp. TaxID=1872145 RepID=UPI002D1FADBE|nr:hypothetical protein [Actinotalea sp.]
MTVLAAAAPVRADATGTDRAALARSILARAEERTGTSRWVRPVLLPQAGDDAGTADGAAAPHPDATALTLPVSGRLAGLLPSRGLDRGTTVVVAGSTSLVLGLLAEVSRAGGWVAVVGMPGLGVLAAAQLGLDLDRVVLVPDAGPDGPLVLAALLDGVDAVVVGPRVALTDADRRRLSARARERSAVLLPTTPWPGAAVVLTAGASRWEGVGRGDGRLRSRRLDVRRGGRGTAAQGWLGEVQLPAEPRLPGGDLDAEVLRDAEVLLTVERRHAG